MSETELEQIKDILLFCKKNEITKIKIDGIYSFEATIPIQIVIDHVEQPKQEDKHVSAERNPNVDPITPEEFVFMTRQSFENPLR